MNFFGAGSVSNPIDNCSIFRVRDFENIQNVIIPFFTQHEIIGVKHLDFLSWTSAAKIIKEKRHLSRKGLDEILANIRRLAKAIQIKNQMNRSRPVAK
jgi:hypothetical protein